MLKSPFKIKEINMSSTWVYNIPKNNDCTICRCNLNTPSLYNQEKGIDSYVVSGQCLHSFHQECIKPWVDKNNHCPICSCVWQYNKTNQTKILNPEEDCSDLPPLVSLNTEWEKEFNKLEKTIIINKKNTGGYKQLIDGFKTEMYGPKQKYMDDNIKTILTDSEIVKKKIMKIIKKDDKTEKKDDK